MGYYMLLGMYVSAGSDADSDDLADALMLDMEKGVSCLQLMCYSFCNRMQAPQHKLG